MGRWGAAAACALGSIGVAGLLPNEHSDNGRGAEALELEGSGAAEVFKESMKCKVGDSGSTTATIAPGSSRAAAV